MRCFGKTAPFLALFLCSAFVLNPISHAQSSNTWTSVGPMDQARTGAAAVALSDGRVLITGGTDANGIPLASAEFFDPATDTFSAALSMHVPRANHAAILLSTGDVLVTGGVTSGGALSDSAELFSASAQQWTLLDATLGQGLSGHAMANLADGNVLIAGGQSTAGPVNALLLFNAKDQSITQIGQLLAPRTGAVAAATPDGRVLIAGGTDANGAALAATEIFVYDAANLTGTDSAGPSMSVARTGATATTTYDGVAIIGGNSGQADLGSAEIFSQWSNTFRTVSGATPRSGHIATLLPANGSILAMGGTGGQAADLLQPWVNNMAGAFLAAASSLSNQDGGFAAPAGLGSLLAAGGEGDSATSAEFYDFPTISTNQKDYAPGTPVVMNGTGFKPMEAVDLHLHEWVDQTTADAPDYTTNAGIDGSFSFVGYAPTTADLGARYHLTAVGESSGLQAQTIFTDGKANKVTVASPTSATVNAGATAVYGNVTVSFNGTFNSNSPSCTVALSATGLPSGASAVFGQNSLTSTGSDVSTTFSVTTTGSTTTGTYSTVQVTATDGTGCQDTNATSSNSVTLTVNAGSVSTTTTTSSPTITYGQTATSTVTVKASSGSTSPTGSVTMAVNNGGSAICGALSGTGGTSTATCTITYPGVNSYTLTPTYTPGTGFTVGTVTNGTLTVNPLAVTLTGGIYSGVYDGNTHALTSCATSAAAFVTCSNNPAGPVGPDVNVGGPTAVTPTPSYVQGNSGDYTITSNNGSWSITPLAVTLTGGTYSGVYDGNTHALTACTSTSTLLTCTNSPLGPVGPHVGGPTAVTPTPVYGTAVASDFNLTSTPGSWSITAKPVTLTAGNYSGVYDGSTHPLTACGSSATAFVTCANNPAGPVGPDVNVGGPTAVAPTPSYVQGNSGDYTITSTPGSWSITPLGVTITGGSYSHVYDGSAHAPSVCTSSYAGVSCTNNPASVGADVGSGSIAPVSGIVTGIAADYNITPANGSWSITALAVTLTGGTYSGVYDGSTHPLSACGSSSGLLSCTNSPAGPVGADVGGPTAVTPTPVYGSAVAADFNITSTPGSWQITPLALTLTAGGYSGVYDGSTHTLGACSSSNSSFVTCTNNPPGPVGPDVNVGGPTPVAPVPVYGKGNSSDYTFTSNNGSWSITALAVTLTGGTYSGVYDGSQHALTACSSSSPLLTCTNSPAGPVGPGVNVGGPTAVAPTPVYGSAVAGDFNITSNNGSWQITPKSVTLTAGGYSGTYDGNTHALLACGSSAATFVTCANNPSADVGPNVGSGAINPVVATYLQGDATDYSISNTPGSWSITALAVTLTGGSYGPAPYDGGSHPLSACASNSLLLTCTNNPVGPVGPGVNVGGPTAVAPVPAYPGGAVAGDFNITSNNGSWQITPKSVTFTAGGYSGTYDGNTHALLACGSSAATFVTCSNNPSADVGPNVGGGTIDPVVATYLQGDATDYSISNTPGSWSITALAVTLTGGSYGPAAYDGSQHALTACGSSSVLLSCTNSPAGPVGPDVNVGGPTAVIPTPVYGSAVAGDFTITSNNGSWQITAKPVTLTAGGYSGTYDGSSHALLACSSSAPTFVTCSNNPSVDVGPNVGNGTIDPVVATYAQGDATDYSISNTSGSWSITALAVTLTGGSYGPAAYDGNTHTLTACASSSGLLSCTNGPAGPVGPDVNVGGPTAVTPTAVYGSGAVAGDFIITSNNGSWSITAKPVTFTAGGYSGTYDGNSHALLACSSSAPTFVTCSNNPSADVGPNVGTGTIIPAIATYVQGGASDYSISNTQGSWSITALAVTLTGGTYNGVYDGNTHTLSACASSSVLLSCTNNPAGPVGPNAGGPTAVTPTPVYGSARADDFNITYSPGSFTITKANATVVVTPYNVFYDGNPHTATVTSITGVNGETGATVGTVDVSHTTHTVDGTYNTDYWTFTGTANYNSISAMTIIDTIKAWTVTGFYSPVAPTTGTLVWNLVKGGSTVPLKFNIYAGSVQETSTAAVTGGTVAVYSAACIGGVANNATDILEDTGATSLRYDTTGMQFIQNWKTPKGTGCYVAIMTAADGSTITAYFTMN